MSLTTFSRYWHTVRYLRPVQIFGRLWFRLYRPKADRRPAPPVRKPAGHWRPCKRAPRQHGPTRFEFIGQQRDVISAEDWNRPDWPKLWLYNLHYFDDLVAAGADARSAWHRSLIARWIAENPPAQGNGWEPYPVSLRLVNWSKWLLCGNEPVDGMLASMAIQTRLLRRRLEHHLLGNHLWTNLKALIFSGTLFEGDEADRWRQQGLRLFGRELDEQILADGGHFERSPMYHAILLEDLLDLIQLDRVYPGVLPAADVESWRNKADRMLGWLQAMTHPDGEIAFFNDAAFDIAPGPGALFDYARAVALDWRPTPPDEVIHLAPSGYVRLQHGAAIALIDAAPIGPDYLPGHAHADTLSFELAVDQRRVLVNGGTSTYENNAQRQLERSTAMHNTVTVDNANSSQVWGAFRVARRARVLDVHTHQAAAISVVEAAHDGYCRLPGRVIHHREWQMNESGLTVEDRLDGSFRKAVARFRVAPDFQASAADSTTGRIAGEGISISWRCAGGRATIEDGYWHPRFGKAIACKVLVILFESDRITTEFQWQAEGRA